MFVLGTLIIFHTYKYSVDITKKDYKPEPIDMLIVFFCYSYFLWRYARPRCVLVNFCLIFSTKGLTCSESVANIWA